VKYVFWSSSAPYQPPAIEDDPEFMQEFFGLLKRDIERPKYRMGDQPHKKLASFFAPEWSALILGLARALLGLAFHITKPITGHADSMVFPKDPNEKRKRLKP